MQIRIRIILVLFIIIAACKKQTITNEGSRVSTLPFYNDPSFTPHWIASNSNKLATFHKIPDFKLTNQNGETITQETFKDKIYIVDFFFSTCSGICPKMTDRMLDIQEEFKDSDDVLILSHSVTPSIDSVSQLKKYALENSIGKKWHLVTGDKKQIYNLGRNFYFVEEDLGKDKSIDDFLHTENFLLIDKNKHIRGIYNGLNRASIAQLIIDTKALKKEI